MKKYSSVLVTGIMIGSVSCSAFQPRQQSVTITASEPGAEVLINDKLVGGSPVTTMLDRDKTYAVAATIDGRTGTAAIGRRVSPTGALDIAGGILFLVPIIGVFTPGFWELDPTLVQVHIPEFAGGH